MDNKKVFHLDIMHVPDPLKFGDTYLFQIGRFFSSNSAELLFDVHAHSKYYELTIVLDGEGVMTTNNVPVKLNKNDIYLTLPTDIHKIESDKKHPLKYDFISFNTENSRLKQELDKIALEYLQPDTRLFRNTQLASLVDYCITEIVDENPFKDLSMNAALNLVITNIIKNFSPRSSAKKFTNPDKWEQMCYLIMDYINSNIFTIKSLNELCERFNYSYPYLSAIFKKHCSQNLSDYYQFQKLEKAKELIFSGKYSLTEIAEKLGYSSIYAFSKAFKKQYGNPPSSFKQTANNK